MRTSCNSKNARSGGSCTDYYVHLNLFECLACPEYAGLTATFSILGREVAPKMVRTDRGTDVHSCFARIAFAMILSIPLVEMFREALKSALLLNPQAVQQNRSWLGRFFGSMCPH